MRITTKGQVTIPQEIRDSPDFQPGTEVDFIIGNDGVVRVVVAGQGLDERCARLCVAIDALRGAADVGLTTGEIMALVRE